MCFLFNHEYYIFQEKYQFPLVSEPFWDIIHDFCFPYFPGIKY